MSYELRAIEDRVPTGGVLVLPAALRVLYVVHGTLTANVDGRQTVIAANEAWWHGESACRLEATGEALAWRWELAPRHAPVHSGRLKLAREVPLVPGGRYVMRCDRVDFPLGGVAYTHTHGGPGIRILIQGRLRVEAGGHAVLVSPEEAWFESGPEPVYAAASEVELTSFVRVLVLPVELQGKSSIRYVNPEDQGKPKSQRYTIFVDAPISP